jgi:hypothetical protein
MGSVPLNVFDWDQENPYVAETLAWTMGSNLPTDTVNEAVEPMLCNHFLAGCSVR